MFFRLEELRKFSTYTMIKKSSHSKVLFGTFEGIPVAVKEYHRNKSEQYKNERNILLELNGKFRTPRLLSYNDYEMILYIEWIAGERLKEYTIQNYLGYSETEYYKKANIIIKAKTFSKMINQLKQ